MANLLKQRLRYVLALGKTGPQFTAWLDIHRVQDRWQRCQQLVYPVTFTKQHLPRGMDKPCMRAPEVPGLKKLDELRETHGASGTEIGLRCGARHHMVHDLRLRHLPLGDEAALRQSTAVRKTKPVEVEQWRLEIPYVEAAGNVLKCDALKYVLVVSSEEVDARTSKPRYSLMIFTSPAISTTPRSHQDEILHLWNEGR